MQNDANAESHRCENIKISLRKYNAWNNFADSSELEIENGDLITPAEYNLSAVDNLSASLPLGQSLGQSTSSNKLPLLRLLWAPLEPQVSVSVGGS